MLIICPDCGADHQEVGKYCENCGRFLTEADAQALASGVAPAAGPVPAAAAPPWDPNEMTATSKLPSGAAAPAGSAAPAGRPGGGAPAAHFAVVRHGQANPAEDFTLTHPGEYLVGRPNMETGSGVDIDLRQWVQPLEVGGQKQYLVHRNHAFLGLAADGAFTVRACPGAEGDTLVRPAGQAAFVPLDQFGTVRAPRPDATYPLQPGDQLFMGDPSAVRYYQTGDSTAQGTYVVLELLPV